MNPDRFQQAWRTQSSQQRLTIDTGLLLQEVRRNQRSFAGNIFWRDVREVGTALLLIPIWFYLGFRLALPGSWYAMVPALVWVAGFMLADRMRHRRKLPGQGESLRQHIEHSLAQVEQQIWLLRNVLWWYLLPPSLAMLAFFGQITWEMRAGGWWTALVSGCMVAIVAVLYAGIYRLNQSAVRTELEPRRRELEALLLGLRDEAAAGN